jgi:serine/threonine protein kinase
MVSHLFEDNNQTYMLMEYIDGFNLEKLRKQQAEDRFTLSEVLALLAPIVDAVSYLHRQPIPVLHRDIKPANIVQKENGKTVLVDFGIAKEYHPDTTTTAIRHCSAGYSAPEQYSGVGTDPRSDVYSLGATCYTLLTGTVPMDALQRTTTFVTKGKDPQPTLNELVPALSIPVTHVLQRAIAISAERRYATVAEFWQALNNAATLPPMTEQVEEQEVTVQKTLASGSLAYHHSHHSTDRAASWRWHTPHNVPYKQTYNQHNNSSASYWEQGGKHGCTCRPTRVCPTVQRDGRRSAHESHNADDPYASAAKWAGDQWKLQRNGEEEYLLRGARHFKTPFLHHCAI